MGLVYDIEKMSDSVHQDIKMIIAMQYQSYPPVRSLDTEMALKAVEFISVLVRWIDDNHESLLAVGNIKKYVWWITNQFIRFIFEDYLAPVRSTEAKTSFNSYFQCQNTLIWSLINGHLASDKMLAKSINDHLSVVGDYEKWLGSNSIRTEAMDTKVVATKQKDKVD